jgi:tRNA G37 N-methylase TrmD
MSNPVGRPQNEWEVKRVTVPKELVPEVKKLIEQWKLEKSNESTSDD